jgi:ABC-type phosphate transport system substrate-binding protein
MLGRPLIALLAAALPSAAVEVQVIANKDAGVATLAAADLEDLYLARKTKLPNGAKATVLTNAAGDETREFLSRFLDRTPASFSAEWKRIVFTGKGSPPAEAKNDRDMVDLVKRTPGAIGYVAAGADVDGVAVLKIDK